MTIRLRNSSSLALLLALVMIAVSLTAAPSVTLAKSNLFGLPSIEELENPNPDLASLVYSEDGVILHRFFLKNRTFVPPSSE